MGFAYGRDAGGVDGLSLAVAKGEKIGIVGASGAGKSTLVALLLRLYDVEAGRITLDGRDIRQITQESLRRNIAMVTQETAMFNRSALENIRYGRPDATRAEIEAAAKAAEAHDFIKDLQDHEGRRGYDAQLGERGVRLSGRTTPAHCAGARLSEKTRPFWCWTRRHPRWIQRLKPLCKTRCNR